MSDIKKKVGKSSLKGLLNMPEEKKPAKTGGYSGGYSLGDSSRSRYRRDLDDWNSYSSGRGYMGYQREGSLFDDDELPSFEPERSKKKERENLPLEFYEDGTYAFVREEEMLRMGREIMTIVSRGLEYRNIHMDSDGKGELLDLLNELMWRSCKVKDRMKPGTVLYVPVDEITGENPWLDTDVESGGDDE